MIRPGAIHRYTSGVPLDAPSGMMGGHYGMVETASGRQFRATVPTFALDSPMSTQRAN